MREGDDLVYFHKLTLAEALSPLTVTVRTLDGRSVSASPHEYAASSTVLTVAGEGMPCAGTDNFVMDSLTSLKPVSKMPKGDLKIKFRIEFPRKIMSHHRDTILHVLAEATH